MWNSIFWFLGVVQRRKPHKTPLDLPGAPKLNPDGTIPYTWFQPQEWTGEDTFILLAVIAFFVFLAYKAWKWVKANTPEIDKK